MVGRPDRANGPDTADGPDPAGLRPGASLDVGDIAWLLLEIVVPKFSDGGAVFVLEGRYGGQSGQVVTRRLANLFVDEHGQPAETVLPVGEVFAFPAGSPYGEALSGAGPQVFGRPDNLTMQRIRPAGREILSRHASFLAVPVTADGAVTGLFVTSRGAARGSFSAAEVAVIAGLASRAGAGMAHAAELARHRPGGAALRPGPPPLPPFPDLVEVAWRSTPAPGQVVGGDWWDIVTLPGMRTGLVVGDVMGHGSTAAPLLAQLRIAAHTLADLDLDPAELMRRLDCSVSALTDGACATCVYAVVDPRNGSCTMSLAGHLSPVLALPDGRTYIPGLPAGLPVGLGTGRFGQVRIKLPPGAILALYTDGLVESRTLSFERGILALRAAISGEHGALADTCDSLIESLHHDDDVTVILARIPG